MRLIDADALIQMYNIDILMGQNDYFQGCRDIIDDIKNAPTIDAVPVVHAHWYRFEYPDVVWIRCSACEKNVWSAREFECLGEMDRYCPHCGAKMQNPNPEFSSRRLRNEID